MICKQTPKRNASVPDNIQEVLGLTLSDSKDDYQPSRFISHFSQYRISIREQLWKRNLLGPPGSHESVFIQNQDHRFVASSLGNKAAKQQGPCTNARKLSSNVTAHRQPGIQGIYIGTVSSVTGERESKEGPPERFL